LLLFFLLTLLLQILSPSPFLLFLQICIKVVCCGLRDYFRELGRRIQHQIYAAGCISEELSFDSWHVQKIYLFLQSIQIGSGAQQVPYSVGLATFSSVVKRTGLLVDYLPYQLLKLRMNGAVFPSLLCLPGLHTKQVFTF
jgi:hypothetical protein